MRRQFFGLAAAAVLSSGGTLLAQEGDDLFTKLDANKDGFVALDEVPEGQKSLFERLLRKAGKEDEKKLNKVMFAAALKSEDGPKQPLGGPGPGGRMPLDRQLFERQFDLGDASKDGKLTKNELQTDSQREAFDRMLKLVNPDGDGSVTREQYIRGMTLLTQGPGAPRPAGGQFNVDPKEAFARLDANKDGKLSKDELPERMRDNLARVDANGDGVVTPEEFGRAAQMQRPPGAPGNGNPNDPQQLAGLFDRTDANSDGKLTKDEVPEDRPFLRRIFEQVGSDSLTKEQFVRAMAQAGGQPGAPGRRPEGAPRPDGAPRPAGAPERRPEGTPAGGPSPGGGLFATLDTDHDGQLSTSEIVAAGSTLLKLDRNGDGKLTPDEAFSGSGGGPMPARPGEGRPAAAANPARPPEGRPAGRSPEALREQFKASDANHDGKLSKDEAPEILKQRFDRLDANSDGFLDETELRQVGQRLPGAGSPPARRRPEATRPAGEQPKPENK